MWPGDHDNDGNDDDMFPMLWQARDSLMELMFSLSCRDKWAAGNSRHMAPFIALWSERESPFPAGQCHAAAQALPVAADWSRGWSRDLNTGLWLADNGGGADGCGEIHSPWWWRCYRWCYRGWKHTLSMSLSLISSLTPNWKKPLKYTPDFLRAFTCVSLIICQTNNKCADCLHSTRGPNNKAGPPVRISAW